MRLGFIGTGRIASDIVEGLSGGGSANEIYLSPRNRVISGRLASAFPGITVARDNQSVVDSADAVFLSVLPSVAADVLRELTFSPGQLVISLVAMFPLDKIRLLTGPAMVVRAVPLPSVRRRQSPTVLYPDHAVARELFSGLGRPLVVDDEDAFCVVEAVTGLIKPVYVMLREVSTWMEKRGIPEAVASQFVVDQFHSMLGLAAEAGSPGLDVLGNEAATPGGLNHQATELLRQAGTLAGLADTLDAVLERIVRQSAEGNS